MANYKTIHEVAPAHKKLRGARLSLEQVNAIFAEVDGSAKADGSDYAYQLGQARAKFQETHDRVGDQWVAKPATKKKGG